MTVEFRNTGGAPVTSGTITFATHIIDARGIDWATIESTRDLPVPIGAGEKKEKTWVRGRLADAARPAHPDPGRLGGLARGRAESQTEDQAADETGDRSGG